VPFQAIWALKRSWIVVDLAHNFVEVITCIPTEPSMDLRTRNGQIYFGHRKVLNIFRAQSGQQGRSMGSETQRRNPIA